MQLILQLTRIKADTLWQSHLLIDSMVIILFTNEHYEHRRAQICMLPELVLEGLDIVWLLREMFNSTLWTKAWAWSNKMPSARTSFCGQKNNKTWQNIISLHYVTDRSSKLHSLKIVNKEWEAMFK